MTVVVVGCYEWIGYHLINGYLDDGEEIIGIDTIDTSKKETLSMFFGRNAAFSYYKTMEEWMDQYKDLPSSIYMINENYQEEFESIFEKVSNVDVIFLTKENRQVKLAEKDNCFTIQLPFLYGPWMPPIKNWDNTLPEDALYITDFVDWLKQTDFTQVPDPVQLVPKQEIQERENQEGIVHLTKQVTDEKGVSLLNKHMKQFPQYY